MIQPLSTGVKVGSERAGEEGWNSPETSQRKADLTEALPWDVGQAAERQWEGMDEKDSMGRF